MNDQGETFDEGDIPKNKEQIQGHYFMSTNTNTIYTCYNIKSVISLTINKEQ